MSRHAQKGLAKVMLSLPANLRQRLADCGELLGDDPPPIAIPSDRQLVHETICRALAQRKRVWMLYRERDAGHAATTRFGLYRLACHHNEWCLVGHSTADQRVCLIEIARIERLELTDEPYAIPPRFRLEKFFEKSTDRDRLERSDVRLASSGDMATAPGETAIGNGQRLGAGRDRTVELSLETEQIDKFLRLLTDRGDHTDLIEPEKRGQVHGE